MELTGSQLLPIPRDRVWEALIDPGTLRAAIPGCEFVTDEGSGVFSVGVLAAVGPVKARFKGRMQQQDLQPPNRYTLSFEGDGGLAGFAKGSAEIELLVDGGTPDSTRLNYRAQAQIGGRLAQIGSRLIDATAEKMSAQFFERLTQVITAPAEEAVAGTPAHAPAAAAARPAAVGMVTAAQAVPGMVTIQMPAWAWTAAVVAMATVFGWVAVH